MSATLYHRCQALSGHLIATITPKNKERQSQTTTTPCALLVAYLSNGQEEDIITRVSSDHVQKQTWAAGGHVLVKPS